MTEKVFYLCEGKNSAGKCTICYFSALDFQVCKIKNRNFKKYFQCLLPYFQTYPDNMYF